MANKANRILMWALTYRCNIECTYCFLESPNGKLSRLREEINDEEILSIANGIVSSNDWRPDAVWLTGGEPTLKDKLLDVVKILEGDGIKTIITTNGVCNNNLILKLCELKPKGITISLDYPVESINNTVRSSTNKVVKTIKEVVKYKKPNTKLGIAITLSKFNIHNLSEFAGVLSAMGVDYMSINPLYNWNRNNCLENSLFDNKAIKILIKDLNEIYEKGIIELPCNIYLKLFSDFLRGKKLENIECPACYEFAFISPWGRVYPCSSEFWHTDERMINAPHANEFRWTTIFKRLRNLTNYFRFSSHSACFGNRCFGCWKLYYDDVFI